MAQEIVLYPGRGCCLSCRRSRSLVVEPVSLSVADASSGGHSSLVECRRAAAWACDPKIWCSHGGSQTSAAFRSQTYVTREQGSLRHRGASSGRPTARGGGLPFEAGALADDPGAGAGTRACCECV